MKKLFLVLTLIGLTYVGGHSQVTNAQHDNHNFEIAKNLDILNSIYCNLDWYYVDSIQTKELIRTGIDAMLSKLDPYTVYYAEEEMKELEMMTTGKYGGIGSIIRMRKDSTVIIAEPYAGMPATEVGLQVGDVLRRIDKTDLKGKNTEEVSNMLRGEPGTTFTLEVDRPVFKQETFTPEKYQRLTFNLTRRNIKVPAISYYGMIDTDGYICLTQFTEDCSIEVRKAVIALRQQGAQRILLDLRSNGGGLLDEAVKIVNIFIPAETTIVEVKGRGDIQRHSYKTTDSPLDTDIPVIVLVNQNTASASEIVAGALQDLRRGTVVGTKTFGKGLVQSSREIPYNGSLKLTTGKYYLPSGRCIQRIDYKARRETRDEGQETRKLGNSELGGITPDIEVKHDTLQNILFYINNDDALVDFGTWYYNTHDAPASVKDFSITDDDLNDFLTLLKERDFKYDRISERYLTDLKKMMEFEDYYDDAKEEYSALEKKLSHNIDKDVQKYSKDIRKLLAQEIIKRYFFQAGATEEFIKDDEDIMATKDKK